MEVRQCHEQRQSFQQNQIRPKRNSIQRFCFETGIKIMVIYSFMAFISFACDYILLVTLRKTLPDIIEELQVIDPVKKVAS